MSEPGAGLGAYFEAARNPVVLTGSSAFIVEIGVLQERLLERDAEIERLKREVAHWIDMASQADILLHRYERVIEVLRESTLRDELELVLAEAGIL